MTKEELEKRKEKELSLLFYKSMNCPICEKDFKFRTTKSGKLKVEGMDDDLRQRCNGVDPNKYHVVFCPHCGYASISRYFDRMPDRQVKLIKEKICGSFEPTEGDPEYISYREAFKRYHQSINCALAKGARPSEMAYNFLKAAWNLRGEAEEFELIGQPEKVAPLKTLENRFLKNAYDTFTKARMEESYPMCGMDEITVDYLLASLAISQKDYDVAMKLLSTVITSYSANGRMKDRARELKDIISEEKKLLVP